MQAMKNLYLTNTTKQNYGDATTRLNGASTMTQTAGQLEHPSTTRTDGERHGPTGAVLALIAALCCTVAEKKENHLMSTRASLYTRLTPFHPDSKSKSFLLFRWN